MGDSNQVQLGFALPLNGGDEDCVDTSDAGSELGHRSPRWSSWDGGKVGGVPSWLNPRDLPEAGSLRCRAGPCAGPGGKGGGTPLRFVAQLYCPADDDTGNAAAFHRSLYVFACPDCSHPTECVRVLRCQLPKENEFYPPAGSVGGGGETWSRHTSQYWAKQSSDDGLNLCAVSGQRSRGRCPKQRLWFCGPEHQKEHLKALKRQKQGPERCGVASFLRSVYAESELVVEEEPAGNADSAPPPADACTNSKSSLFPAKDLKDADADLEQSDLNAMTGNALTADAVTDPATIAFFARMAIGGEDNDVRDQCLRYSRWPRRNDDAGTDARTGTDDRHDNGEDDGPLWVSSDNLPPAPTTTAPDSSAAAFPPPCQYCGAPRAFEFQILPQMLHHLSQRPEDAAAAGDADPDRETSRPALSDAERAVLLEAQSKIEGGADLPEGFREQHERALATARRALFGDVRGPDEGPGGRGGLDWGTVAVYTCTASCGAGERVSPETGAYMEEAAWMQPPLD